MVQAPLLQSAQQYTPLPSLQMMMVLTRFVLTKIHLQMKRVMEIMQLRNLSGPMIGLIQVLV